MRVLIGLALLSMTPGLAGIVVLKNGTTFVGKLDGKVLPPCPKDAADMPELVVMTWPHNGQEGPEGRARWEFKGHELRWYDLEADAPTNDYWEEHFDAEIERRWHAARERFKHAHKTEVELVPSPKVELWKGLERSAVRQGGLEIHPPLGWTLVDAEAAEGQSELPADEGPLRFSPGEQGGWSAQASLEVHRAGPEVPGDDLDAWVSSYAKAALEPRGEELVETPEVRRTELGLVLTFSGTKAGDEGELRSQWRVVLRDTATYCGTFTGTAEDLDERGEVVRRCLSTLKVPQRD
ncbi:MAG: hypothetical protein R3F62_11160 [Planctomycetota bacterium]